MFYPLTFEPIAELDPWALPGPGSQHDGYVPEGKGTASSANIDLRITRSLSMLGPSNHFPTHSPSMFFSFTPVANATPKAHRPNPFLSTLLSVNSCNGGPARFTPKCAWSVEFGHKQDTLEAVMAPHPWHAHI